MNDIYIDSYYENASALIWEQSAADIYDLTFVPDHERFSPNCQFTHWNFAVVAAPKALGRTIRLRFRSPDNTWNGRPNPPMRYPRLTSCVSFDGVDWRPVRMEESEDPQTRRELSLTLDSPRTQICNVVPYTGTMLERTLHRLATRGYARVYGIGITADKRPVEMVEIGNPEAPWRVLIRARAHPWESGGSWLLEGLYGRLTSDDPRARDLARSVCFYTVPMACKDGVYRGMTRYNTGGCDLNRDWNGIDCFDPVVSPENHALQVWLNSHDRTARRPDLAICIHNDDNGQLHIPPVDDENSERAHRFRRFEELLTEHTWFREGSVVNPSPDTTFAGGLLKYYGIDALIYELNASWSVGLNREVLHTDWIQLGRDLVEVFTGYFRVGERPLRGLSPLADSARPSNEGTR